MVRNVVIRVRASKQELESIKNNARVRGYPTVSAFLRSLGVERDFWMEKKVQEIHFMVKEVLNIIK